jgi:glutathione S-transferase
MRLITANLNYSSWTMRAWLALKYAGVPFSQHDVELKTREGWKSRILDFSGAGTVPILIDGPMTIHESLAICEYVAELRPEAELWPTDRHLRAKARALSCEMVGGFAVLREQMPSNLRLRSSRPQPRSDALDADVARFKDILDNCLAVDSPGDFLLGKFGIVDCMYMPLLSRLRTYGVPLEGKAAAYSERIFDLDVVRELEALANKEPPIAAFDE